MSRAHTRAHALTASLYANTATNQNCMVSRAAWSADKAVELPPDLRQSLFALCIIFTGAETLQQMVCRQTRTRRSAVLWIHRRTRLVSDRTWHKSHQSTKSSWGLVDPGRSWVYFGPLHQTVGAWGVNQMPASLPLCHVQWPYIQTKILQGLIRW